MNYESVVVVPSRIADGVSYSVARMSFGRRLELMRRVRDLAAKVEFLEAGQSSVEKMDAGVLRAEVDRLYVVWGLKSISGLMVDSMEATPELLAQSGPEGIFREALAAVRAETGLTEGERKN